MKFKKYFENNFDDFFPDKEEILNRLKKRGKEVERKGFIEPLTIICYRGFDADLESIKTIGDKLVLSPKKSEQGMLWFTHKFINHYNPMEYIKGRGEWLLTYPLKAKKIYDLVTYEDGSTDQKKPQNIDSNTTENNRHLCFWDMCIELPENWFFSYKTEKFIVTNNQIYVDKNMITKNN